MSESAAANSIQNPATSEPIQSTVTSQSTAQTERTQGEVFYDLFYSSKFGQYAYRSYIFFQIVCLGFGIMYLKQIDPTASKFSKGILAAQIISTILFFFHILIYIGVCIFRKFKKNQSPFDRERGSIYQIESLSLFAAVAVGLLTIVIVGAMLKQTNDAYGADKHLMTILASVLGLVITNFIPWILSGITAFGIQWFLTRG